MGPSRKKKIKKEEGYTTEGMRIGQLFVNKIYRYKAKDTHIQVNADTQIYIQIHKYMQLHGYSYIYRYTCTLILVNVEDTIRLEKKGLVFFVFFCEKVKM